MSGLISKLRSLIDIQPRFAKIELNCINGDFADRLRGDYASRPNEPDLDNANVGRINKERPGS